MAAVRTGALAIVSLLCATAASAQNWSFDARKIGLGSPGSQDNLATRMIEDESDYRAIVLPFGLIQVFRDFDTLNPTNDQFDIVRAIEYSASPIHYTFGRDTSASSGQDLFVDIRNAALSRDLNDYKGFVPANQPAAGSIMSPSFGGTIRVKKSDNGAFHGVYIGAGPYISSETVAAIDQQLINILGSPDRVYLPNVGIPLTTATEAQLALAITGGYRGRIALPGAASDRDGVYLAANYNHLRGFRYEDISIALRLDTDRAGLLTVNPLLPSPLAITRIHATSGTGRSVDLGAGIVVGPWEAGFGANGVGNRISWSEVEATDYAQTSLLAGDFSLIETGPFPQADREVTLPVEYSSNVAYNAGTWRATAEFGKTLQGNTFHGGGEYRFGRVEVRGGGVYSRERWNPAVGGGLYLGSRTALDVALYGNMANIERKRHPAVAVSVRMMR